MTHLTSARKHLIIAIEVNNDRSTLEIIARIAKTLGLEIGQQEQREYVQLMNLRKINLSKEPTNARETANA